MRQRFVVLTIAIIAVLAGPLFAGGQGEAADDGEITVTLGYNAFLSDSFTDAPPPIEVIRSALAEEYPNITLEYETMSQDLLDQLIIWMTSRDTTVDIYGIDVPWVSQFGRAEWAVPLNDRLPELEERFSDSGLDTFSYEGRRLGVPFWGSIAGLFYRMDILEEYGFDPPESVDDIVEIVQAVQEDDPDATGILWPGAREEDLVMYYSTLLHSFGGSYTNADGSYAFDSESSLEAVRFMRETIENGISPRAVQNWNRQEGRQRFSQGEGIFLWDNTDIAIWLDDPERSEIVDNWGLMTFPAQSDGEAVAITGGFAFAANPYSENIEAAVNVLDVIGNESVQKGFALAWGPVQYYQGLYEDPEVQEYNPNVETITPLTENARSRPPSESYAELSGILQEQLNAIITGIADPEEALEQMNERANRLRN
jgi:multiple sugar transport system substrate-binding protein